MNQEGIFIIFGITGDLAKRKLLPALYYLFCDGVVGTNFKILGTTRRDTKVEDIISELTATLESRGEQVDKNVLQSLTQALRMVHMDIANIDDYSILKEAISTVDGQTGESLHRLYYLAVPPEMFEPIVAGLGAQGLNEQTETIENRLLIEKPFGHNTQSAVELIEHMEQVFSKDAVYRVDHYLAKETAQNILTFRFNNPMFEAVWKYAKIDHILITAAETIGIEGRINFYDNTGAMRDLIQSHLLQLLALVIMDEPADRSAQAIHAAKIAALQAVAPIQPEQVATYTARGQYNGYQEEVNNSDTLTETYAAIRLNITTERWANTPVLLRAGKSMQEKITEISLVFRDEKLPEEKNILTIRIQPNEGIVLSLRAKKPSLQDETEMVQMEFCYDQSFNNRQPDAYERVLADAIRGDKTLFTTDEEVLASWNIIEHVITAWSQSDANLESYEVGSWGPPSADKLAASVGASWLTGQLQICPVK